MTEQQGNIFPGDSRPSTDPSAWGWQDQDTPEGTAEEAPLEDPIEESHTLRPGEGAAQPERPSTVTVDWLELPVVLEHHRLPMPAATADFIQVAQLANLIASLFWGNNDFYEAPEEKLAGYQPRPDMMTRIAVARLRYDHDDVTAGPQDLDSAGRIVGYSVLRLPQDEGAITAQTWVGVHPGFRRLGIGSALLQATEHGAIDAGRTRLQSWTDHVLLDPAAVGAGPVFVPGAEANPAEPQPAEPHAATPIAPAAPTTPVAPERIAIDSSRPDAQFAAACGFSVGQTELTSVLNLRSAVGTAQQIQSRLEAEATAAGSDYEIVDWTGPCPEQYAEALADLWARMPSDIPSGEMTYDDEEWDVDRLRRMEEARAAEGLVVITAAALHRPTGELVAHSDVETYEHLPQVAYQENTLVHPDHRGHRLAMRLKARTLPRLLEERPEAERLYTWNAVENESILRVNRELGYTPAAVMVAWQKVL